MALVLFLTVLFSGPRRVWWENFAVQSRVSYQASQDKTRNVDGVSMAGGVFPV